MCSDGGKVAVNDQALQDAELAKDKVLTADYGTTFAQQQAILGSVKTRMAAEAANPMGYSPQQLKIATTSINENFANSAKKALGSAAAFAAAHGSADIGGGSTGALAGEIGAEVATGKAQALSTLAQQSEGLKQENKWKALSGLMDVGSAYGGQGGTSLSGSESAAGSTVSAGSGVLAAKEAGWQHFAGVLGGISGLATAATGF